MFTSLNDSTACPHERSLQTDDASERFWLHLSRSRIILSLTVEAYSL